jgi:phenylalanyl-tRNA synthetase beta chain
LPVVRLRIDKLSHLVGRRLSADELTERLASLGLSVEDMSDGELRVEYNPNRPDYSSSYGIARALKAIMGVSTGMPRYIPKPARITVNVDPKVGSVRPYIACAIIRRARLGLDDLEEFIAMQEDLHWVMGRNRRVVAIGLHDLASIREPFTYSAVGPADIKFTPLKSIQEMTPQQIIREHEIGRKYGHLVSDRFPVLLDCDGRVFSMPPIINAKITELKPGIHDIFIDVTGLDETKVSQTLNILAVAFADHGGVLEKVRVVYPDGERIYPDLRPGRMLLDTGYVRSLLGLRLSTPAMRRLLAMSCMEARVSGHSRLTVWYPAYRTDILHPVDLVEEIAIAYGYSRMNPSLPKEVTYGSVLPVTEYLEKVAEIMMGMGFTEVMNLLLTNEVTEYRILDEPETPHIRLANPATRDYTMLRTSIIPSLLRNLSTNQDNPYPQRIFEAGTVVIPSEETPERAVRRRRLGAATCHAEADFTEIRKTSDELLRLLEVSVQYRPTVKPAFVQGRCAAIVWDDSTIGHLGEISPAVLSRIGLNMPTAVMELDLDHLMAGQSIKIPSPHNTAPHHP